MIYTAGVFLTLMTITLGAQLDEGDSCTDTNTNSEGRCTNIEECQSAKDDWNNNAVRPTFCAFTFDSVLVCCRDGNTILQEPPVEESTDNRKGSDTSLRVSIRKCEEYSKHVIKTVEFVPLLLNPLVGSTSSQKCKYQGVELILGGEDAKVGEFPHMAAIGWDDGSVYKFSCGGSLISPRFVLTAGHCTYAPRMVNPSPVIVKLGDHNINPSVEDGASPVEVPIKTVNKHPDYKPPIRYNDIALLELATDVTFGDNIRPACLWANDAFDGNDKAIATGWGVSNPVTRKTSDVLQKVVLSILTNEYCNETLASGLSNRNWEGFVDTQLCAGELRPGKDTCEGDSGAPLQITLSNNTCIYYVIGLTSFGTKTCGTKPAVYTRVSKYLDWIESIVWPEE